MSVAERALFVPVLLGTPRQGRQSEHAARFMAGELARRPGVASELLDVRDFPLPADDAGEAVKPADFAARMERADALVVVCPEYNHGYPGALKSLLDTCLKEYVHKPVGVVGVSAGPWGGTRAVQDLLPVLRELGLVAIFWDFNVTRAGEAFDADGRPRDADGWRRRADKFAAELLWMAETLRHGRLHVAPDPRPPLPCPACGAPMNLHAEKLADPATPAQRTQVDPALGGILVAHRLCPVCGHVEATAG